MDANRKEETVKKERILVIFLGIFLTSGFALAQDTPLSFEPGSEPDGFRGIKLGAELSTLQGMKHRRTDASHGGIEFYSTEEDSLIIGGGPLESIQYGFWKGRLYVVMITTKGLANWNALKEAVFDKFGTGAQAFKAVESYLWEGENVAMASWYNETTKKGIFYMRSLSMKREMDAEGKGKD